MKTINFYLVCVLIISAQFSNAQTNQANIFASSGGLQAGLVPSGAGGNSFYGYEAGKAATPEIANCTFIGSQAGKNSIKTLYDVFIGASAGYSAEKTNYNIFIGNNSGYTNNSVEGKNVMIGHNSGYENKLGSYNTFLGYHTGYKNKGNSNVFIGYAAGAEEAIRSNQLYIDNSSTKEPLIYGDFLKRKIGIGGFSDFPATAGGADVSKYSLFVKGGILTEEVRIRLKTSWADYVFADDYKLPTLEEVEKHIQNKGHLINVPSAAEVEKNGIELGEMAKIQQEKIEELTLYLIQQNKEIELLKAQVKALLEK